MRSSRSPLFLFLCLMLPAILMAQSALKLATEQAKVDQTIDTTGIAIDVTGNAQKLTKRVSMINRSTTPGEDILVTLTPLTTAVINLGAMSADDTEIFVLKAGERFVDRPFAMRSIGLKSLAGTPLISSVYDF
jgi:hypothetical protein